MTLRSLRDRLSAVTTPALVVRGEADQICDPAIGCAYAAATPDAQLRLTPQARHLPQIEQPDVLSALIWEFLTAVTQGT